MGKKRGGMSLERLLVLVALSAGACGRSSLIDEMECSPGDARICDASGAVGAQTCKASGYWSECKSGSSPGAGASTNSGGSVGSVGAGGFGAIAGASAGLGGTPVAATGGGGEGGFGEGGEGATEPSLEFGRTFAKGGLFELADLAAKPSGAFSIAVSTTSDVDFGPPTTPLLYQGGVDAVVAEFDADAAPLRATIFGDDGDEVATSVAYDSSGALIAAETHSWDTPGVRLKRTDASGDLAWTKFVQGPASAVDVAVDQERNVVLTGVFAGAVDFGGGILPESTNTNIYVVKFDQQGTWLWGRELMGYHCVPTGIATDSEGNVIVVGSFFYDIDFGWGSISAAGASDVFVAKFSPAGEVLHAHTYGGNDYQEIRGVAVLSDDSFAIGGRLTGDLDLGANVIHGSGAVLVARFSATGTSLWAKAIESTSGEANAFDVAVDPFDNIVLVGSFQGTLQVPKPVTATGIDAFVIGLDRDGDVRWAQRIGGPNGQDALAVATDAAGDVLVGGRFFDAIDFGEGDVSAGPGVMDLFVAKIKP
jgi:hypothetical protein